jgi:hypothetical protein
MTPSENSAGPTYYRQENRPGRDARDAARTNSKPNKPARRRGTKPPLESYEGGGRGRHPAGGHRPGKR